MSLRGHHNSKNSTVETASFLIIRLGTSYVALPAEGVRGVLTQEEAGKEHAVTSAGTIYQPVDLAQRLSVIANLSGLDFRTVLYSSGPTRSAIGVEEVVGLADVERKDCLPLPTQFRLDERNWFQGIMLHQDKLVLILNPSGVLREASNSALMSVEHTERLLAATPASIGESC
jgi:chemotaxis signal transduction protein